MVQSTHMLTDARKDGDGGLYLHQHHRYNLQSADAAS